MILALGVGGLCQGRKSRPLRDVLLGAAPATAGTRVPAVRGSYNPRVHRTWARVARRPPLKTPRTVAGEAAPRLGPVRPRVSRPLRPGPSPPSRGCSPPRVVPPRLRRVLRAVAPLPPSLLPGPAEEVLRRVRRRLLQVPARTWPAALLDQRLD